jgi:hypothetical protein
VTPPLGKKYKTTEVENDHMEQINPWLVRLNLKFFILEKRAGSMRWWGQAAATP